MGLHHLYNEHSPCISSSHLHWEVRLRADRNIPFSSQEAVSATGSKQNPNVSPWAPPLTPPLTHTHTHTHPSKLLAVEKHCLVVGQKLYLRLVQRGAGTAEVSGLLQSTYLQRRPGRASVMPSGHLHPWSRRAVQSPVPRPWGRTSWRELGMKLHTPSSPIEFCA